jgi:hypothetical protein
MGAVRAAQIVGFMLGVIPTTVLGNDFYSNVFNGAAAMGGAYMSNAPMPAGVPLYSPATAAPAPAMAPVPSQSYQDPFHQNRAVDTGSGYSSQTHMQTITPQQLQNLQQNQVHMQQPTVQHVQPQVQYQPQVMRAPVTGFNAPQQRPAPRRH